MSTMSNIEMTTTTRHFREPKVYNILSPLSLMFGSASGADIRLCRPLPQFWDIRLTVDVHNPLFSYLMQPFVRSLVKTVEHALNPTSVNARPGTGIFLVANVSIHFRYSHWVQWFCYKLLWWVLELISWKVVTPSAKSLSSSRKPMILLGYSRGIPPFIRSEITSGPAFNRR